MLTRLQLPHIQAQGYVNLRCVWTLGCPAEIQPIKEYEEAMAAYDDDLDVPGDLKTGPIYKTAFEALFPGQPVPETIGASCCAQFAVTGEKVRQRLKSDYEAYRRWLLETELPDHVSGRVLEYSWHSKLNVPVVLTGSRGTNKLGQFRTTLVVACPCRLFPERLASLISDAR